MTKSSEKNTKNTPRIFKHLIIAGKMSGWIPGCGPFDHVLIVFSCKLSESRGVFAEAARCRDSKASESDGAS